MIAHVAQEKSRRAYWGRRKQKKNMSANGRGGGATSCPSLKGEKDTEWSETY